MTVFRWSPSIFEKIRIGQKSPWFVGGFVYLTVSDLSTGASTLVQEWQWFRLCKVFQFRIPLSFRARVRQLRPGHLHTLTWSRCGRYVKSYVIAVNPACNQAPIFLTHSRQLHKNWNPWNLFHTFQLANHCQSPSAGAVWRCVLYHRKNWNHSQHENRRRVRCSAVFVTSAVISSRQAASAPCCASEVNQVGMNGCR